MSDADGESSICLWPSGESRKRSHLARFETTFRASFAVFATAISLVLLSVRSDLATTWVDSRAIAVVVALALASALACNLRWPPALTIGLTALAMLTLASTLAETQVMTAFVFGLFMYVLTIELTFTGVLIASAPASVVYVVARTLADRTSDVWNPVDDVVLTVTTALTGAAFVRGPRQEPAGGGRAAHDGGAQEHRHRPRRRRDDRALNSAAPGSRRCARDVDQHCRFSAVRGVDGIPANGCSPDTQPAPRRRERNGRGPGSDGTGRAVGPRCLGSRADIRRSAPGVPEREPGPSSRAGGLRSAPQRSQARRRSDGRRPLGGRRRRSRPDPEQPDLTLRVRQRHWGAQQLGDSSTRWWGR